MFIVHCIKHLIIHLLTLKHTGMTFFNFEGTRTLVADFSHTVQP